jgi:hypothetical protein
MDQAVSPKLAAEYRSGGLAHKAVDNESSLSGVSWAAVIGGGFVTAAISLILLSLGAGLGLSSISIGSHAGSAATIGMGAILWLILMQSMSSSLGGYLAGRLRTKWTSIHSDEVYFRDTVHGFLSWAVALVVTAAFLASAAASMMGIAGSSNGAGAFRETQAESQADSNDYFVDSLLRSDHANLDANSASVHAEVKRILVNAFQHGGVSPDDQSYLDRLVIARTGLNQTDADKRVSDVVARAGQAAETVRKATAHVLLWTFIALLIGAFCASFAATIGGKQRDRVPAI